MAKHADCHGNKAESHSTNRGKSWSRTEGSGGKNREKGKVKTNTGEIRREKTTKATDIASQISVITALTTLRSKEVIVLAF